MKRNVQAQAVAAGAALGIAGVTSASAQSLRDRFFGGGDDGGGEDIASAGNGGVATASSDGGAVGVGDINSGGNAGNAIGVGDTSGGSVGVDGGLISNLTDLGITSNGGTSIADASGGNYNLAFVS